MSNVHDIIKIILILIMIALSCHDPETERIKRSGGLFVDEKVVGKLGAVVSFRMVKDCCGNYPRHLFFFLASRDNK